jgi:hypothetical protein
MAVMMAAWEAEYPEIHTGHFLFLRSLKEDVVGDVKLALLVLLTAVGVIVLIVCANVANIQLARATTRQREVAVRAALGGSRRRLVRQFLTESAMLALAGGLAGVVIAWFGIAAILAAASGSVPRAAGVDVDAGVALFALAVTALTALVSGALPAYRAAGASPQSAMREGDRSSTHGAGRTRGGLDRAADHVEREHRPGQEHAALVDGRQVHSVDALAAQYAAEVGQQQVEEPRRGMGSEKGLGIGEFVAYQGHASPGV